MFLTHDHNAPKKPTNLSLNGDLLKTARDLDINLSASLEQALEVIVRQHFAERWLSENREAMTHYNAYVDAHGVFSDGLRNF